MYEDLFDETEYKSNLTEDYGCVLFDNETAYILNSKKVKKGE